MKVRIVKCSKPDEWYAGKIGDILTVRDATAHFYAYEGQLRILKEDCEILESDEPKPEPFDLERALKGDRVVSRNGLEVTQLVRFEIYGPYNVYGVIQGKLHAFDLDGYWHGAVTNTSPYDLFMAPREPEYQTVWVNLLNECPPGAKEGYFTHHATLSKEESLSILEPNDKVIGTFPITFKKP